MKTKNFLGLFLLLGAFFASPLAAQIAPKIEAYKAGETLRYAAKYSKTVLRGIEIADVNFSVERVADSRNYAVKSTVESKGTLSGLVLKDFLQKYESTVDGRNFSILETVKSDSQGKRLRESRAIFDYKAGKVVYVETDPNDAARSPLHVASKVEAGTQDLISAVYALRRLSLAVGKDFEVKVSDSGLVYTIPVRVTAREQQKSIVGKVWCFRVEPQVFGKNRLVEKDGTMIFWITDDARRLPVRAQINVDVGRVEVKLKAAENIAR